jgi:hypothetical protein
MTLGKHTLKYKFSMRVFAKLLAIFIIYDCAMIMKPSGFMIMIISFAKMKKLSLYSQLDCKRFITLGKYLKVYFFDDGI